ncbi:aryl-alcohol dehydrogenase-like predicted oxidoreductase [Actinomadura pelletieri DSM 43383]|uniref:Aryl-alcohol dehydrogenase-like predicted oxidoreductase n=1 Tax=Actinomadura pelletieri DSM 43383 TaxID=1120940 RepID=A0A495QN23_9ACTN|nr:aldo/keto reductase [Actinomadura pelletieri]RKS74242.1 aryl-alcohol dehydrogenase-like predicted oxidoreductase [Actinomadura pelletieri DSM 43383]
MSAIRRLGIGLAALGRPAYINVGRADELPGRSVEQMRAATWSVLDTAYAAGIRWVDTARSYGRAEEFLGGWLTARRPEELVVSSKWGYTYVGDWKIDATVHEVKEHSITRYRDQYDETRALLNDYLSVYQVHSLTEASPLFQDVRLQAALAEAAADGVRVGFSTSGPRQAETIRKAMALEVSGRRLFSTVQSTWNVLETSAEDALREAHAAGLHVLVKEVLANGRLAAEPPLAVRTIAAEKRVGPDAVALAAALSRPWAGTVLLGAVSPAQLRANLAGADLVLDETDLGTMADLSVSAEAYWAERSALPWT